MRTLGVSICFAISLLALNTAAHGKTIRAPGEDENKYPSFYARGISLDGSLKDWPESVLHCNYEAKVFYAAGNDSVFVYAAFIIMDPSVQKKIRQDGLLVWIDPSGKKKKDCSILFTFGPPAPGQIPPGAPPQGTRENPAGGHYKTLNPLMPRQAPCNMKCAGFAEKFNGNQTPGAEGDNFEGFFSYDTTGALQLETRIPLKAFAADPRKSPCMAMGCEVMEMERDRGQGDTWEQDQPDETFSVGGDYNRVGGGGERGSGGNPGGGHGEGHGRSPGEGAGGMQNQAKTYRIWYRFSLAPAP